MDLPATATKLDAVFRGKGVSGPLDWAACELDCMGIGLHGNWTAWKLDSLRAWLGAFAWETPDCMLEKRIACWSRGL